VSPAAEVLAFEDFAERLLNELELAPMQLCEDARLVDDLGFDSVLVFELLLVVEDWIGVMLPEALIGQLMTMGDVYAVFRARAAVT
jgi:acyl carrier protein